MNTPTGCKIEPLNPLSYEDWEALEEMFEALEAVPLEQNEIFTLGDWVMRPPVVQDEEASCAA
jgi:hypothetical protein